MLLGDVAKAHRRVKVRREDWGLQACRLEPGKVWLNCVGTYGIACAGYWWSRLSAAVIVRLFYYLITELGDQDALLFADDLMAMADRKLEIIDLASVLLVWLALGIPWKWKKFRGGARQQWIGYWVDVEHFALGISEERSKWLVGWVRKTIAEGTVEMSHFRAVLGRLSFMMGALDFVKPFVCPLFAWAASIEHDGRMLVPWSVAFILGYIAARLEEGKRTAMVRPRAASLGPVFRADAKAEGQEVVIGGWECSNGCPPSRARWFSVALSRATAPWAYGRGEPFKSIASIELFATLVSLMAFGSEWRQGKRGTIQLTGLTDNSGNTAAMHRLMSSKFPLIVILTEVAAQLEEKDLEMDLEWVPRNQNEEADALTNGRFEMFDPKQRIDIKVEKLPFLVMDKMLDVANALYGEVSSRREAAKARKVELRSLGLEGGMATEASAKQEVRKAAPLRQREPW